MKVIAMGDTHGRSFWMLLAHIQPFDQLIFLGDYFDSCGISDEEQIRNFREIIAFKEINPGKVILLLGNHDFHYLPVARSLGEMYSGLQDRYVFVIGHLIQQHRDILQVCYWWEDYLFTHAGVSQT